MITFSDPYIQSAGTPGICHTCFVRKKRFQIDHRPHAMHILNVGRVGLSIDARPLTNKVII